MSNLPRVLEPELLDTPDEACTYDAMDHSAVNRQFVADLLTVCPAPRHVLDVGTGNALIPIELCGRVPDCRVTATDLSRAMLQQARRRIEAATLAARIELDRSDAKQMHYGDGTFDLVLCNGTLHHFADPSVVLRESLRVTAPGGWIFFRDLQRPDDLDSLERFVASFAGEASALGQQLYRQSLQAALTRDEMRATIAALGYDPLSVQTTSDRHWTWSSRKAMTDP